MGSRRDPIYSSIVLSSAKAQPFLNERDLWLSAEKRKSHIQNFAIATRLITQITMPDRHTKDVSAFSIASWQRDRESWYRSCIGSYHMACMHLYDLRPEKCVFILVRDVDRKLRIVVVFHTKDGESQWGKGDLGFNIHVVHLPIDLLSLFHYTSKEKDVLLQIGNIAFFHSDQSLLIHLIMIDRAFMA